MPDISIIKLKIRRGTDAQRQTVVLEEGELGYTTDTRRVFVGDGLTSGGIPVSNKFNLPLTQISSLTSTPSFVGDVIYASTQLFQLTASDFTSLSSWAFIGTQPDNTTLEYNTTGLRTLKLKNNSINNLSFNSTAAYSQGGIIATATNGLSANVDGTFVVLSSNYITIAPISASKISSSALGNGIRGGNGDQLYVYADPTQFGFNGSGSLTLTAITGGVVSLSSLNTASILGDGLYADGTTGKFTANVQDTDNSSLELVNHIAQIRDIGGGDDLYLKSGIVNSKGQITGSYYTITNTFTGATTTVSNVNNIFYGSPDQISEGYETGNNTVFTASSSNGTSTVSVYLSSAGFLAFESTGSKEGTTVDRFAIPIFTY